MADIPRAALAFGSAAASVCKTDLLADVQGGPRWVACERSRSLIGTA